MHPQPNEISFPRTPQPPSPLVGSKISPPKPNHNSYFHLLLIIENENPGQQGVITTSETHFFNDLTLNSIILQRKLYQADTVLSRHPLLSGQQPKSPNLFPFFTLNEIFIKRTWTPTMYLKWSFLLLPTCIKRTLVIKFYHPTCQTPKMRKIFTHKFF